MIPEAFITLGINLFQWALGFLPVMQARDLEAAAAMHSVFSDFVNTLAWANFFFPIDAIIKALIVYFYAVFATYVISFILSIVGIHRH
jgi:hypothetical protein